MAIIQHVILSDMIKGFVLNLVSVSIRSTEFHWMCQKSYSDTGAGAREELKMSVKTYTTNRQKRKREENQQIVYLGQLQTALTTSATLQT